MSSLLIFLAIGLAMDAFAISITNGICMPVFKIGSAFKIAMCFGMFQAIMPIIGWAVSVNFSSYIERIDHWIAFILLVTLGGKMMYDAFIKKAHDCEKEKKKTNNKGLLDIKMLLVFGLATSLDALVAGVSFACLNIPILNAAFMIGIVTSLLCFIGVIIGRLCGGFLQKKAELAGGTILILIAFKILLEHL